MSFRGLDTGLIEGVKSKVFKGRKGELILKRRCWKFEGVEKWLKREIDICAPGTKLEKEFANFLKEFGGDTTGLYL
jgi:hypothetical protein